MFLRTLAYIRIACLYDTIFVIKLTCDMQKSLARKNSSLWCRKDRYGTEIRFFWGQLDIVILSILTLGMETAIAAYKFHSI
jgi:hypothetical protein